MRNLMTQPILALGLSTFKQVLPVSDSDSPRRSVGCLKPVAVELYRLCNPTNVRRSFAVTKLGFTGIAPLH